MQALLSIALVWLSGLRDLLSYLGFTLSLSAAATVSTLFLLVRRGEIEASSVRGYPWAPSIFVAGTVLLACLAASQNPMEMAAAVLTVLTALAVYRLVRRNQNA